MSEVRKWRYSHRPQHFRVLIEIEQLPQTRGGIVVGTQEKIEEEQAGHTYGTIVEIGETAFQHSRFGHNCPYKVGDFVKFRTYAGEPAREFLDNLGRWSGKYYRIVNDDDLLAVYERTPVEG